VLREAGFDVREEPFDYSAFPGRYATALGGLASTALLLGATWLASRGAAATATAFLVVGGATLAGAAAWTARRGVLRMPFTRHRAVNLTATRGTTTPAVWLVAHLDSKSQPVPILVRAGAIAFHGITWAAALLLCIVEIFGGSFPGAWAAVGAAAVTSGLPIVASVVGARSAGAVDNASGVTAVLMAAASLPPETPFGVVVTSAEELGLAGARAWVRGRPPAVALNCDGIDDAGELLLMYSGAKPSRLVEAFERAARLEGQRATSRHLLPGVLVDGVAFADAGWEAITLSRGTINTLARIHTPRDNLALLTGAGIDDAVPVLTRVARELT
jgi:hypothetical protein